MAFQFVTLTNGKVAQAIFKATSDGGSPSVPTKFAFKHLTNNKTVKILAFIDTNKNLIP